METAPSFLQSLLDTSQPFMPHGHCFFWNPGILWPRVIFDGIIFLSYLSISIALFYFVRKRKDVAFHGIFIMFGIFILGCGTTHLMEIITVWAPHYRLENIVKGLTAFASISTAIALWPLIPKALALPGPKQLEIANRKLQEQISQRKNVESELRELNSSLEERVNQRTFDLEWSKKKYEELVNTVDGVVWESVVGTSPYALVSRRAEKLLGYPLERWLTESGFWQRILHPEDREKLTVHYQKPISPSPYRQVEYRLIAADGRVVWIRDFITVISTDGKPRKLCGIMVDITEQKKIEEDLIQAQTVALKAAQVKAEFLANVSHEIRTPLNAIIGMTQLIRDTKLNPEQAEYAQTIYNSGEALLNLINDILDFSKVEAGKLELEITEFNLDELVRNAIDTVSLAAKRKGLILTEVTDPDLPKHLRGDYGRILQILMNLLSNAIKFTSQGSITLKVTQTIQGVRFEVKDTGIGINKDSQGKLFTPFYQSKQAKGKKYDGTGLGLSISKKIVSLMNGQIGYSSEENVGSSFWFTLPLEKANAPIDDVGSDLDLAPLKIKKGHILIAEDNVPNQKVLARFLEKSGHRVDVAANGLEAISAAHTTIYDLILMDCQMPEMDGYQAAQEIRKDERKIARTPVPIVALTANALAGDREKCLKVGMNDYLSKPIKYHLLNQAVAKWLGEKKPLAMIDRGWINELNSVQGEGNETLLQEVVKVFFQTFPETLRTIEELIKESTDFVKVSREAHSLKSTCHSVGARAMAEICQKLEDRSKRGNLTPEEKNELRTLTKKLHEHYSEAKVELEKLAS